ncbi:MAG: hypothetical protein ACYDCL_07585 [Myxococcales bacterium]
MTNRPALLALLALAACSNKPPPASDGGSVPDICNSQSDAQSDSRCQLTNGTPASYYLDHQGKELWLGFQLPAQLTAKSLLSIQAGYAPQTGSPVQLAMSAVSAAGAPLVSRVVDDHDPGPPGALSVTVSLPVNLASQMIFILLTDDGGQHFDAVNPFSITASVTTDPDPNLPGVPTTVSFSAPDSNQVQQSSPPPTGVLSTPGRVDEYSITIPANVQRPILYFSITVPSELGDGGILAPPIDYLMGYTLYDCGTQTAAACAGTPPATPSGALVATDHMPNDLLIVNLDAARLVKPGDTYLLEVAGWQDPSSAAPVQGDLRATYRLDLEVLPDVDPCDDPTNACQVGLSLNQSTAVSGRLSLCHSTQTDLFSIAISPQAKNTRIHYLFAPSPPTAVGRFPPLSEFSPVRVAALFTPVPGTPQDCESNYATCPNDSLNLPATAPVLVGPYCEADGGPFCLYSFRQEDPYSTTNSSGYTNLQNFEGVIPVKAGTSQLYLSYQDQRGQWADDLPYTLTLTWEDEGQENQGGYHMSEATARSVGTLAVDSSLASFPAPPAGATQIQGDITVGNTLTSGKVQTIHGTNDYDAIPSTLDVWEMDIPSVPNASVLGETWELQWQIQNGASGSPPCALAVSPMFCSAGNCNWPSNGQSPFYDLNLLVYQPGEISDWASLAPDYGSWPTKYATTWRQTVAGGSTTDTAQAAGCYCFDPASVSAGKLYLVVQCTDRATYEDAPYVIQTAVATYPQSLGDGGTCPELDAGFSAAVLDAGIPDGSVPVYLGCEMQLGEPSTCGNQGDSCTANSQCCSQSCNITNPSPTGGNQGNGSCN